MVFDSARFGAACGLGIAILFALPGCYDGDPAKFRESVVVGRDAVTALAITGELPVIEVGTALRLSAQATTTAGAKDISGDVEWRSSNPTAVFVDATGHVTALANGTAQVSATLAQFSDTVTMTASNAHLQSIAVTGPATIDECSYASYSASGTYDDTTVRDVTSLVAWSADTAATGRVSTLASDSNRFVSIGTGTVGIRATRGSVVSPPLSVTVSDNLDSITLSPASPGQIANGDSLQFTATGHWGAAVADISRAASWSITNTDTTAAAIATVRNGDSLPGLVSAANGGTGTLAAACGGQSATEAITVTFLQSLAITNTRPIQLAPNASLLLVLEGTYSDSSTKPLNESAIWTTTTVSGTGVSVSTVAGTRGRVTAGNADGVSTVMATLDGKSVSVTVNVTH